MKRAKDGKFVKAKVKVGQKVCCTTSGFNPGFTQYKSYIVLATCRSSFENKTLFNRYNGRTTMTLENEAIVVDDDGVKRIIQLEGPKTNNASIFGRWHVLPE